MSTYIVLNSREGSDQQAAAVRLARMFKMEVDQAVDIVEELIQGGVWKFEKMISEAQAKVAENYLRGLGFDVRKTSISPEESESVAPPSAQMSAIADDEGEAIQQVVAREVRNNPVQLDVEFHGNGWDLAKIMIVNWIKTVLTLGIYYFWGKTRTRRYLFEQSSFAGDRFYYHGTGGELVKGWLILVVLIGLWVGGESYAATHLDPVAYQTLESGLSLLLLIVFPALMVGAYRYRLSRSSWRNIRFSFRATRKQALWLYIKGTILTLLTFGLYFPYFQMQRKAFWNANSHFGNKKFEFTGNGREIFKNYIISMFLTIFTLGFYYIWYHTFILRYSWSHTHFGKGTFRFNATGWQYFKLAYGNFLLLIVTVGLAYPWTVIRDRRFTARHLTYEGDINLDKVVQDMQKSGAMGEGALDAFDIPLDIV